MCGIAGFVGSGDRRVIEKMTETLRYRGPDDDGFFVDPRDRIALGFRRLSVIDLKGGGQPIFNEDKKVVVIFNGEIYNFKDLRRKLLDKHRFYTNTDTDVIVHLYEERGEKFLSEIEGMFAIALWDSKLKKLLLARDRVGEKPLYWMFERDLFAFASEPKALFMHPGIPKELDRKSLFKYMMYEYIPSPNTIFKNIKKIEPAHYLVFQNNNVIINRYYDITSTPRLEKSLSDTKTVVCVLEQKLDTAVRERLVADVPVGVFLSGGLDSSTIAYFAQKNSQKPIKTFSIGFEEPSFNESSWAEKVARRIGADHHTYRFTAKECVDIIPGVFSLLDEPLADASLLPTYLLARFTRKHVTVALGGDGADELFFGYNTFVAHKLWKLYAYRPQVVHKILTMFAKKLPVYHSYFSFDFKLKRFLEADVVDDLIRNQLWLGAFHPNEYKDLFSKAMLVDMPRNIFEDIDIQRDRIRGLEKFLQLGYSYLKHYMAEDILVKIDRATMFNSLEVRSPFLDTNLAEYVFSLPVNLKLHGFKTKYILKRLMTGHLGADVVNRSKQGFSIPLARWLAPSVAP